MTTWGRKEARKVLWSAERCLFQHPQAAGWTGGPGFEDPGERVVQMRKRRSQHDLTGMCSEQVEVAPYQCRPRLHCAPASGQPTKREMLRCP